MKRLLIYSVMVLIMSSLISCDESDCCDSDVPQNLIGEWLMTEIGYSPGDRYIVEQVSPTPPQTISLQPDNRFESNIDSIEDFSFFQVFEDPNNGDQILALLEQDPDEDLKLEDVNHSYNVVFEDGLLKLYYRYCFEGCHMGFASSGQ